MHILIADDHTLFRDALALYIRRSEAEAEVTVAKSLQEAMGILEKGGPDIDLVLLDLRMPGMFGLEGLAKLRTQFPAQKIAIMSGTAEEDDVKAALDLGAVAYFPKTMAAASLIKGIQLVMSGERFVPLNQTGSGLMPAFHVDAPDEMAATAAVNRKIDDSAARSLTAREREVLKYLVRGASNKEIANDLNLQIATIKLHVRGICRKLNAKNRTQAALLAQNLGLFEAS